MATKLSDAQIKKAARQGGDNELLASKGPVKGKAYPPRTGNKQVPQAPGKAKKK